MTKYDWILKLVKDECSHIVQKISTPVETADPTVFTPVTPKSSEGKNYYVSMGYASVDGQSWRPAMIAICVGYNVSEAVSNCIYIKGAMQYSEKMPTIPGQIWQKMDELWDSISSQATKAIDNPLQDIGKQPQMQPTQFAQKQANDDQAVRVVERLDSSKLAYVETVQVEDIHIAEALFTIPTADVFGEGEDKEADLNVIADLSSRTKALTPSVQKSKNFSNPEEAVQYINTNLSPADPSGDAGSYIDWIVKQDLKGYSKFPEDISLVREILTSFNKNKSRLPSPDINSYQRISDIQNALKELSSKTEQGKEQVQKTKEKETFEKLKGTITIAYQQGPFTVLKFTNGEDLHSACYNLGMRQWCIGRSEGLQYAKDYVAEGPAYVVFQGDQVYGFIQDEGDNVDFTDRDNNHPPSAQFVLSLIPVMEALGIRRFEDVEEAKESIVFQHKVEEDPQSLTDEELLKWVYNPGKRVRIPQLESRIAKNAEKAYYYALNIVKGKWPPGEQTIAQDSYQALNYSRDIVKGKWPQGEAAIAKDSDCAYLYATQVIKGRFLEGEAVIAKDPLETLAYAREVIKGRWPEAEPIFKEYPDPAQLYAEQVIKGKQGKDWYESTTGKEWPR